MLRRTTPRPRPTDGGWVRCPAVVSVAIDEGPLHGPRTGIGNAVAWLIDALEDLADQGAPFASASEPESDACEGDGPASGSTAPETLELLPYLTSMRASVSAPTRRLPLPAAVAHRLWSRTGAVPMDRFLGAPDVVHGTNYVVPPTRCPRLVTVYDCWFLEHPGDAHPDVARAGRVLRRSVADGAHVVTSSEATAERIRDLLDTDRVTTIHLGPPPFPAADAEPTPAATRVAETIDGAPFVLALGTVERRKDHGTLVAAFDRLAREHPSVGLVVAGGPGDASDGLAAALGRLDAATANRVHVLGRIDDPTKTWLLAHAAAVAYPSLDEGFGFPVLEAQSAGVPVVASSAGSIPEVAGTGALLSAPSDVDALAANLHWAVTSETKRTDLVERGRRNLKRFSWARTARDHLALYERLSST